MKAFLFYFLFFFVSVYSLAQSTFSITLLVEDSLEYTAYRNEPLIFTTGLVNKAMQQNVEWNRAADAWLLQVAADYQAGIISKEDFEKETELVTKGKKPVKAETVGSKKSPWYEQLEFRVVRKNDMKPDDWPIKILGNPPPDAIAVLDEDGYYFAKHHLRPGQVSELKAGTYKIQVLLAGIRSNEVTVKIRKEDIPHNVLRSTEMMLRLGHYYLERKDAEKALDYAKEVLDKEPANISGLILSGESRILEKEYKKALADFEKALKQHNKQFPNLSEEPVYLLGTVEWLKKKL